MKKLVFNNADSGFYLLSTHVLPQGLLYMWMVNMQRKEIHFSIFFLLLWEAAWKSLYPLNTNTVLFCTIGDCAGCGWSKNMPVFVCVCVCMCMCVGNPCSCVWRMPWEIDGSCLKQIGGNTVATCDLSCIVVVVCYYGVAKARTLGNLQSNISFPTAKEWWGIFFFFFHTKDVRWMSCCYFFTWLCGFWALGSIRA